MNDLFIMHYGVGHDKGGHSGRYPWGSGKNPKASLREVTQIQEKFKSMEKPMIDDLKSIQFDVLKKARNMGSKARYSKGLIIDKNLTTLYKDRRRAERAIDELLQNDPNFKEKVNKFRQRTVKILQTEQKETEKFLNDHSGLTLGAKLFGETPSGTVNSDFIRRYEGVDLREFNLTDDKQFLKDVIINDAKKGANATKLAVGASALLLVGAYSLYKVNK